MQLPKITIVTPSYNQASYIEQTIDSVLSQNYPNLEYIIIDGGSNDDTLSIIKKYEKYLTYWVSEKDLGQADAINKGLCRATGNIFNWINSDDFLTQGSLMTIADYFQMNPEKNVLCGFTKCFNEIEENILHVYQMKVFSSVEETIFKVEMNQPATFYKLPIIRSLGGLNDNLHFCFDDELWFKYLCKYGISSIGFDSSVLANFRLHEDSKSVKIGFNEFLKERNAIYKFILSSIDAPKYIKNFHFARSEFVDYYSSQSWDLTYLNSDKFLAYFSLKYINSLFNCGLIEEANDAMNLIIREGLYRNSRILLSIRLKLFLFNVSSKIKRKF